jgi:SAM-dependent methyltransferase
LISAAGRAHSWPIWPERAGSLGQVTGVDDAEEAVRTAGALVQQLGLGGRVNIVRARIQDTGLAAGSFDAAFMRNMLVHNGPSLNVILQHIAALLRPGGHLLAVEPDVTGLLIPDTAPDEQDLEQRWITIMRKGGNDPVLGRQLAAVLAQAGFRVDAVQERVDELAVERSPAWTARHALLAQGLATEADIQRWESAISHRLGTNGKLTVQLPVCCVVAARPSTGDTACPHRPGLVPSPAHHDRNLKVSELQAPPASQHVRSHTAVRQRAEAA